VAHEARDVFTPSSQGWEVNWKDVKPIIQISAKAPLLHHLKKILIGSGYDPDIDTDAVWAAEPLELSFLEYPQQFGLKLQGKLTNLIEEEGSPVGQLKASGLRSYRTRERSPLVAEKLAFQQAGGNRGAVQLDEGSVSSPAMIVNCPGDDFLARACFTLQQNRRICGCHNLNLVENANEGRTRADDLGT
jgi:hypothetical protein